MPRDRIPRHGAPAPECASSAFPLRWIMSATRARNTSNPPHIKKTVTRLFPRGKKLTVCFLR